MSLPASVAERLQALVYGERVVAYLGVDADHTLIAAGGHLENYGLETLRLGKPALDQAFFLEGLIPPPELPYCVPTVELGNSRAADIHFHLDADTIWIVLLDVTAARHDVQRVQQKAYDVTLLQEREALLNRRLEAANAALIATQRDLENSRAALIHVHDRLQSELAEAAGYVLSLLPAPMSQPFVADWRFVPSTELGGDGLGYHWIDPNHFALYILDVCGHGVGSSLLSVAILNLLQSGALRDIDFRNPGQVLGALNETYQMHSGTDLYFTMWYGIYQPGSRRLDFGCAGHPAAVLVEPDSGRIQLLKPKGPPIGLVPGVSYACETITVPPGQWLYLLSDGAFEVERPDGTMQTFDEFLALLADPATSRSGLDRIYQHLIALRASQALEDDFTIVRFAF